MAGDNRRPKTQVVTSEKHLLFWLSSPSLRLSHVAFSDPLHVGVSNVARASSFGHDDVQKGAVAIGSAKKVGSK
ncbi:hypothetical protein Tco_0583675, partial [Tanacetum coccineum]